MRGKIPGAKLEMVVSYFMKERKIIDIRTYEEEFFDNYNVRERIGYVYASYFFFSTN